MALDEALDTLHIYTNEQHTQAEAAKLWAERFL
jgi:hypothetical protein